MGKYHIFLSCEDDIFIENKSIEKILKTLLTDGQSVDIKCIKKHENLELSKEDFDDLIESSIYVFNTHKELDYITSWELGYAMGKGLKIVVYFDENSDMKIPQDVERIIRPIPSDVNRFLEMVDRALGELKPKESLFEEDWDKQHLSAKKEAEATL
jgi:nucleoside 2-deoxyribosyltransferase